MISFAEYAEKDPRYVRLRKKFKSIEALADRVEEKLGTRQTPTGFGQNFDKVTAVQNMMTERLAQLRKWYDSGAQAEKAGKLPPKTFA
jgi:hypothetical protein